MTDCLASSKDHDGHPTAGHGYADQKGPLSPAPSSSTHSSEPEVITESASFNPSSWSLLPNPDAEREEGYTVYDVVPSIEEDGRTYQGYMPSAYSLPIDGEEQDRQDFLHATYVKILGGKLAGAPLREPRQVLDIGTGTGIWAHEFAEQFPLAQVTGTDLSLIQPPPRTPNCQFVLEDSETAEWVHPEPLDYVHLRSIGPCFQDVRTVIRKAYDSMAPGGWIEFQDGLWELQSMDGTIEGTDMQRWMQLVVKGGAMMGQDMTKTKRLKKNLLAAGFVNVVEKIYPVPFSPWPRDRTLKEVSLYAGTSLLAALKGYRKILKIVGLSSTQIDELVAGVKRDLHDLSIHSFMLIYDVYGQKPYPESPAAPKQSKEPVEKGLEGDLSKMTPGEQGEK